MMFMSSDEAQALTVRVSPQDYELLRTYAFLTGTSMNTIMVRAMREFLAEHAREREIDDLVDRAKEKFRETIDRLGEG